jgi:Protein of unknown function (DUF551)
MTVIRYSSEDATQDPHGNYVAYEDYARVWQPIATAPKDESRILVWRQGADIWIAEWRSEGLTAGRWWDGEDPRVYDNSPTHWMPLPKTP